MNGFISNHKPEEFKKGDRVAYVPGHAHGNKNHPDVETGSVSSQNGKFVFVAFDKKLSSQACDARDLIFWPEEK